MSLDNVADWLRRGAENADVSRIGRFALPENYCQTSDFRSLAAIECATLGCTGELTLEAVLQTAGTVRGCVSARGPMLLAAMIDGFAFKELTRAHHIG